MDIDFIVQDTYALTKPQWKLASSYEEAGRAFAELVAQNYKMQEPEKSLELDPVDDVLSSSDEADYDEPPIPDMEDGPSSSEEIETEVCLQSKPPKKCTDYYDSLLPMVTLSWSLSLKKI